MKCPDGTLVVREMGDGMWGFDYPRLGMDVMEDFHGALESWECGDLDAAEAAYRRLIGSYPEFIDAYHHLAILLSESDREEEALDAWQEAVEIGLAALAGQVALGEDLLPWGILENRPFLRAFHGLGLCYYDRGEINPALAIFSTLLAMNPNDNQGARALAIGCDFSLHHPEDVLAVCQCYPDDLLPEVLYGEVLALYQLGQTSGAERALEKAVGLLPLVAQELIKSRHRKPKDLRPGSLTRGGADEAYYYWRDQGRYWKSTPGALDFVRAFLARGERSGGTRAKEVAGETPSAFDIHALDGVALDSETGEEALDTYMHALVHRFLDSPEGNERLRVSPDAGTWAIQLMEFGCNYIGVTLPKMTTDDVEEIVTELIPRKVVPASPDEADEIVPDLLAFWEYLKREYNLPKADSIMKYLREIQPDLPRMVNDPSRFGMAKSLFTMGDDMGFDVTTEEGIAAFVESFNKMQRGQGKTARGILGAFPDLDSARTGQSKREKVRERARKAKRKTATAARKMNSRKKK